MITQAIKNFFAKLFPWWSRKQAAPVEYSHVPSSFLPGTSQEGGSLPASGRVAPQASITPRLSTMEEFPEHLSPASFSMMDEPPETPLLPPPITPPHEVVIEARTEPIEISSSTPTTQQRLEFLRYLVDRGIVSEWYEEKK